MVSRTHKVRGRSRYHGRGMKAGRGAGKRGGRGNAGINNNRVMTRIKYMPGHWGMHGFNIDPSLRVVKVSINLQQVEEMADGKSINLTELGFDKLLGKGKINKSLNITVNEASSLAVKKVEAAGGSVNLAGSDDEWEEE